MRELAADPRTQTRVARQVYIRPGELLSPSEAMGRHPIPHRNRRDIPHALAISTITNSGNLLTAHAVARGGREPARP